MGGSAQVCNGDVARCELSGAHLHAVVSWACDVALATLCLSAVLMGHGYVMQLHTQSAVRDNAFEHVSRTIASVQSLDALKNDTDASQRLCSTVQAHCSTQAWITSKTTR